MWDFCLPLQKASDGFRARFKSQVLRPGPKHRGVSSTSGSGLPLKAEADRRLWVVDTGYSCEGRARVPLIQVTLWL